MLIASDGLEYENITQRLLGNPAKSDRNSSISHIRCFYPESDVRAYIEAYDKRRGLHCDKYSAGWHAVSRLRQAADRS